MYYYIYYRFLSILFLVLFCSSCRGPQVSRLFIGSFTKTGESGFTIADFNTGSGEISVLTTNDVGPNPSYFCFSQRNRLIYVANEVMDFKGSPGGGLSVFKYNPGDASLTKMKEMLMPYGGPCYISMSPDSGFLFLANYPKGSLVVVRLDDAGLPESVTDTILYVKEKPEASHAHMVLNDPAGELIYVTDLGQNRVFRYDFDVNNGLLSPLDTLSVPDGYGPRHFDFSADGTRLYIINELGSKITVFSVFGKPEIIQTISTLGDGSTRPNYCADIHLSNDGKFLYGSNRGDNTIVTFSINEDGTLELAGHTKCGGDWPRNFTVDPSGRFILVGNQRSDSIAVFRIDRKTGLPESPPLKHRIIAPACLKFY